MSEAISFKSCDSGSSEANDDNTIVLRLVVLDSNVDCFTTKMNEIKLVMSTRHKVSVCAFTKVKQKYTAFALTDIQIQVHWFDLITNLSKPNGRGIVVYVTYPLQVRAHAVYSDYEPWIEKLWITILQ